MLIPSSGGTPEVAASRGEPPVGEAIAQLATLPTPALRREWRRLHRADPPASLSRDLLLRAIAYTLQERAHGGLSQSTKRTLLGRAPVSPAATTVDTGPAPRGALMPGVRLVRDWHGESHCVLALEDGFDYRGQRYRSLTQIAKTITGVHWSGPRFFGVSERARKRPKRLPGTGAADRIVSADDHADA